MTKQKREPKSLIAAQLVQVVGGDNSQPLPWIVGQPKKVLDSPQPLPM